MVEFMATDYIANSLLYHAYKQKYLDYIIGPETGPQLRTLLLTTCSTGFCIGEYLGALSEQYPDREVEIHFATRKASYFLDQILVITLKISFIYLFIFSLKSTLITSKLSSSLSKVTSDYSKNI